MASGPYGLPSWPSTVARVPPRLRGVLRAHLRAARGRRRRHPGPDRRSPAASRRPAVSEMIKRMETEGLVDHRQGTIRLTADGRRAGRAGRAPPPPGRALPHRHPRAVVGRGPQGGRQVGARDLRARSRRRWTACSADPTTCPHGNPIPGSRLPGARRRAARRPRASATAFTVSPHPRGARVHPRPARLPRGVVDPARASAARSPRRRPTAPSPSRSTGATWASARSPAPVDGSSRMPSPSVSV